MGINIPEKLDLGEFPSNRQNVFIMNIETNEECEILSYINGLEVFPKKLSEGVNTLQIIIDGIAENVYLFGDMFIKGKKNNSQIRVIGQALRNPKEYFDHRILYNASGELENNAKAEIKTKFLLPGSRTIIRGDLDSDFTVLFAYKKQNIDFNLTAVAVFDGKTYEKIDHYNPQSLDESVVYSSASKLFFVNLSKVSANVKSIDFEYSGNMELLGNITNPHIKIYDGSLLKYQIDFDIMLPMEFAFCRSKGGFDLLIH
ncbi:MAG: hypothetical protein LBL93_00315 [Ruminococcus sp.]|jgi:hypothetical protein|nr:hypothetical protein [Ruminococcus sp.]